MFTCKECDKWETCTDEHKSGRVSKDGDSWAYWCDDFYSKVPVYNYETDRYIVTQSPYNYHTTIVDKEENKVMYHAQTCKPLSRQELREELDLYFTLLIEERKKQIQAELERYYELLYDGVFDHLFENEDEEDE